MRAYLGEVDSDEPIPRRMIKLGVVGEALASMSNVSHYFLEVMGEELSLAILFEDGERIAFSTAGMAEDTPVMVEEDVLRGVVAQAIEETQVNLVPILRHMANQSENERPSREHRFYTALSISVAGLLPNLVRMEASDIPFSTTAYTFSLNGKKVTRVVTFGEIPEDQSRWPALFARVQQNLIRKAMSLAGGNN